MIGVPSASTVWNWSFVLGLSLFSGITDARGFLHASRIWRDDQVVLREFALSALGFSLGIGSYWLSVRYLQRLGIEAAPTQFMLWFATTVIGVAVADGSIGRWPVVDRLVALGVVVGLGWLQMRLTS